MGFPFGFSRFEPLVCNEKTPTVVSAVGVF